MAIENATYIADLDNSLPTDDNDFVYEGDDHLRLLKAVLLNTFPNLAGAVTVTHEELNFLDGLTENVQTSLDNLSDEIEGYIEAGSRTLWQQTTAPTGWTKDTTAELNNSAMRIVTGSVASGGADGFTTVFNGSRTTEGHVLTIAEMPRHRHNGSQALRGNGQDEFNSVPSASDNTNPGRTWNFNVSFEGSDDPHEHDIDNMDLKYYDFIVASKDAPDD